MRCNHTTHQMKELKIHIESYHLTKGVWSRVIPLKKKCSIYEYTTNSKSDLQHVESVHLNYKI